MPDLTLTQADGGTIRGMTTLEFLSMLKQRHVEIQAQQGRLKIVARAGAIDATLRAELEDRKLALLEALNRATRTAASELLPLTGEQLRGRIPLTPAQEGMWLIDHFDPGSVAYNIPEAFRLDERIEPETLQGAVDGLIERHSILRTSFHEEDGELFQSIASSGELRVGFTDLSALADEERERSCREWIRLEGRRPFDLKQSPLVRFHLFRLAEERHVIFVNIHHIISDRRSLYVLREELLALSRSVEAVHGPALYAPQLQFADYAAWTATQTNRDVLDEQVIYWKKRLAGLPAYLELPHSRRWPEKRTSLGATKQVLVSAATRAAFNAMGAEEGASPFMTFLAVFAVALARWSPDGATGVPADFCIGSPITLRKHTATDRMIGLFVNMLAFRCQVSPGMSFCDVLRQVRATALDAYENSDVPFRRLVREINPDRRSQRSPIFQVMFGYETFQPPVANEFQMDADPGTARYDLSLNLSETAHEGLTGFIEYCTDLFEEADIDGLLAGSAALIAEIVRDSGQDVFSIPAFVKPSSLRDSSDCAMKAADAGTIADSKTGPHSGMFRKIAGLLSTR